MAGDHEEAGEGMKYILVVLLFFVAVGVYYGYFASRGLQPPSPFIVQGGLLGGMILCLIIAGVWRLITKRKKPLDTGSRM